MVILWASVVDSVVLLTILSVVLSGTPTINAKEKKILEKFMVDLTFQHGIVINLLWLIIQSNTAKNFTALFITLLYLNVNPKTEKNVGLKI